MSKTSNMKYIRTKDGHIYEIEIKEFGGVRIGRFKNASDNFNLHNSLREWQLECKAQYYLITPNGFTTCEKQANTIEELGDMFVVWQEGCNMPVEMPLTEKEQYEKMKKVVSAGIKAKMNIWLKVAIWTDKGLIYVAKMNDKGELELL